MFLSAGMGEGGGVRLRREKRLEKDDFAATFLPFPFTFPEEDSSGVASRGFAWGGILARNSGFTPRHGLNHHAHMGTCDFLALHEWRVA